MARPCCYRAVERRAGLGLPPPPVAGGALRVNAHELLLALAWRRWRVLLTAVPEFTATASASLRTARQLVALWLLGRAGFGCRRGWVARTGRGGCGAACLAGRPCRTAVVRLAHAAGQRHHAFGWALAGMVLLVAGFYLDALRGAYPMRWLHRLYGPAHGAYRHRHEPHLHAHRQPRHRPGGHRRRAVSGPPTPAQPGRAVHCAVHPGRVCPRRQRYPGWLACASAAALFNLLGDWHVGRPLLRRWPPCSTHRVPAWRWATGSWGWALAGGPGVTAGRHLLTVGAMGLATYAVICIAGRGALRPGDG